MCFAAHVMLSDPSSDKVCTPRLKTSWFRVYGLLHTEIGNIVYRNGAGARNRPVVYFVPAMSLNFTVPVLV
jgi:hypothetical protein